MLNFNEVSESKIFNGGVAGIVENVKASIQVKGPEDKENAPLYKLIVVDANGGSVNKGFFLKTQEDFKEDWQSIAYIRELKHLVDTFGIKVPVYPSFQSYSEALNFCMGKCMEGIRGNANGLYRVAVDYGTTSNSKKYLNLNGYPQCIESMSVKGNVGMRKNAATTPLSEDTPKETDFLGQPNTNFNSGQVAF